MNRTKIEWTQMTWNPVTGCKHDCSYCYARRMFNRFHKSFWPNIHADRFEDPIKVRKPKRIFVCSAADLFGAWIPGWVITTVLETVRKSPWHRYFFLTKNPARYKDFNPWPENAWVGATATDQEQAERALAGLGDAESKNRFVSCEPLLASVDLFGGSFLKWLIIGAQTGPGGKQPQVQWVERLLDWARLNSVPVFEKDNLIWPDKRQEFPEGMKEER